MKTLENRNPLYGKWTVGRDGAVSAEGEWAKTLLSVPWWLCGERRFVNVIVKSGTKY